VRTSRSLYDTLHEFVMTVEKTDIKYTLKEFVFVQMKQIREMESSSTQGKNDVRRRLDYYIRIYNRQLLVAKIKL